MKNSELYRLYHDALLSVYDSREATSGAALLLEELHGIRRSDYFFEKEKEVEAGDWERVVRLIKTEMPLQYIIGHGYFYDRRFQVAEGVLIPRHETEELVQLIMNDYKKGNIRILDIGTGSGAIAVTLALELNGCEVSAIDISEKALAVASENNKLLGANVQFKKRNILTVRSLDSYDVIVSNPPYVMECEKAMMRKNVLDYEPTEALFVPDDQPLLFYSKIAELAYGSLNEGGALYFEINEQLGAECCEMLRERGFKEVFLKKDLNDRDRMVKATK